jgi:signal transduction histidine kinase
MFKQARLNLTGWYLIIIMFLSLGFSSLVYSGISSGINRALIIQQKRVEREFRTFGYVSQNNLSRPPLITSETVKEIKLHTILILLIANTLILSLAGIVGYLLAGKTLRPIELMTLKQKTFMSNAAHEIKTPLTVLKTDLEVTLRDKKASIADLRSSLNSALEEVDALTNITDSLMLQAKVASQDNSSSAFTDVELSRVISGCILQLAKLAKSKNIVIDVNIENGLVVKGDELALTSLFNNIIENAIKYNKKDGSIVITSENTGAKIFVSIQDTGIGIGAEDLPHIFEPFYRVDKSHTKQGVGGVGLGLAITKEIVYSHKGEIKVESIRDIGTKFTLIFPASDKIQKGSLE